MIYSEIPLWGGTNVSSLSHCSLAVQLCNLQNTHHEMKQGVWGFEKWDNIMTKKQIS